MSQTCGRTSEMRSTSSRTSQSPYYRSAGHHCSSLRMTLSRGMAWSSGFECASSLYGASNQFPILYTCKITTATGWQPNCSKFCCYYYYYYYRFFFTSKLWLGNFHLSRDAAINRIRLGGLICSLKSFLQLNMCQELQIFAAIYMYWGAS
jgi:hypothetical protein